MDKEPWMFKKSNAYTIEGLNKAAKEAKPKMMENFDKVLKQENPYLKMLTSRQ